MALRSFLNKVGKVINALQYLAVQKRLLAACIWKQLPCTHAGSSHSHHLAAEGLNDRLPQQNSTDWNHSSFAVGTPSNYQDVPLCPLKRSLNLFV